MFISLFFFGVFWPNRWCSQLKKSEAIDDFESHLGEATEKFERNRGKFERVARPDGPPAGHRKGRWQWDGNVGFRGSKDLQKIFGDMMKCQWHIYEIYRNIFPTSRHQRFIPCRLCAWFSKKYCQLCALVIGEPARTMMDDGRGLCHMLNPFKVTIILRRAVDWIASTTYILIQLISNGFWQYHGRIAQDIPCGHLSWKSHLRDAQLPLKLVETMPDLKLHTVISCTRVALASWVLLAWERLRPIAIAKMAEVQTYGQDESLGGAGCSEMKYMPWISWKQATRAPWRKKLSPFAVGWVLCLKR